MLTDITSKARVVKTYLPFVGGTLCSLIPGRATLKRVMTGIFITWQAETSDMKTFLIDTIGSSIQKRLETVVVG